MSGYIVKDIPKIRFESACDALAFKLYIRNSEVYRVSYTDVDHYSKSAYIFWYNRQMSAGVEEYITDLVKEYFGNLKKMRIFKVDWSEVGIHSDVMGHIVGQKNASEYPMIGGYLVELSNTGLIRELTDSVAICSYLWKPDEYVY